MKRARADPPQPVAPQRVLIDVGGTKFSTTVTTIRHSSYLAGMVDERAVEKFQREAKEKNRESWYYTNLQH